MNAIDGQTQKPCGDDNPRTVLWSLDYRREPANQADVRSGFHLLFVTLEKSLCKMGLIMAPIQRVIIMKWDNTIHLMFSKMQSGREAEGGGSQRICPRPLGVCHPRPGIKFSLVIFCWRLFLLWSTPAVQKSSVYVMNLPVCFCVQIRKRK